MWPAVIAPIVPHTPERTRRVRAELLKVVPGLAGAIRNLLSVDEQHAAATASRARPEVSVTVDQHGNEELAAAVYLQIALQRLTADLRDSAIRT